MDVQLLRSSAEAARFRGGDDNPKMSKFNWQIETSRKLAAISDAALGRATKAGRFDHGPKGSQVS